MDRSLIAPCGLNCALCLGFQRKKNKCDGCNHFGEKPTYCRTCSIRACPEKGGNASLLCNVCPKYPCRRLKDLDKRYRTKYGESLIENFTLISESGMEALLARDAVRWKCPQCGELFCVHREVCLTCGAKNEKFPMEAHVRTSRKALS
jgi:hypothetical protein